MDNTELLGQITQLLEAQTERIEERITRIETNIDKIKEDTAVTREAVNTLLEWADAAQVQVQIPLFRKAE